MAAMLLDSWCYREMCFWRASFGFLCFACNCVFLRGYIYALCFCCWGVVLWVNASSALCVYHHLQLQETRPRTNPISISSKHTLFIIWEAKQKRLYSFPIRALEAEGGGYVPACEKKLDNLLHSWIACFLLPWYIAHPLQQLDGWRISRTVLLHRMNIKQRLNYQMYWRKGFPLNLWFCRANNSFLKQQWLD